MITLRNLFPEAEILGCDIDLARSSDTKNLPGPIFYSTPEAIAEHGPYDLIMANSVLCSKEPENLPFSEFARWATVLHQNLKPGGMLGLYNASYRFSELPFAHEYRPIRCAEIFENGFMPKWTSTGKRLAVRQRTDKVDRQIIVRPKLVRDGDFRDCVFEKHAGPPVTVRLPHTDLPPGKKNLAPAHIPLWRKLLASLGA